MIVSQKIGFPADQTRFAKFPASFGSKATLFILVLLCALRPVVHAASGTVVAWGLTTEVANVTNLPAGLTNVVAVAAGLDHALALRADGTVVAWGTDSGWGETQVPSGLSNVVSVRAGWDFSMALKRDGTVMTWGDSEVTPAPVLTNVLAIAAGGHQFCLALLPNHAVVAWGWNGAGQTNVPDGLTNVIAIAAGLDHSVALRGDGMVVVWGDTNFDESDIPSGLSNVVGISAGWDQTLALKSDGTVVGWGSDALVPAGLSNVVAVTAGWDAGQDFLRSDGTLAYGTTGLSNVVAIARGHFFELAVTVPVQPALVLGVPVTHPAWTGGRFGITASTRCGKVYVLQYADSLLKPVWASLPLLAGTGDVQLIQDLGASAPQRFYRLLEW